MHRRPTAAAALLLAVLGLSSCSGDDDPRAAPTGGARSSASAGEPEASASASGTPSSSADATPGVEPASGPRLARERVAINIPRGWREVDNTFSNQAQAIPKDYSFGTDLILSSIQGSRTADLGDLERSMLETAQDPEKARLLPRRDVNGVEMAHLLDTGMFGRLDSFGTLYDTQQISIDFTTPADMPAKERQALIDAVLASVEWR